MSKSSSSKKRLCLPPQQWPSDDQKHWEKACKPVSFLDDEGGELAPLATASRKRYEMGYGRWIGYLVEHQPGALQLNPASRCTKQIVQAYMDYLRDVGNSDGTILCRLEELAVVSSAMDPGFDRAFLDRHVTVLKARAAPVRSKSHVKTSEELVNLGFHLMEMATDPLSIKHAQSYRDGLIIAFLALHPVRRRNLISFHLGKNLVRQGESFIVVFSGSETKTGVPYQVPLAEVLIEPMNKYLAIWRPVLMKKVTKNSREIGTSLWVTRLGSPMSPNAVSGCIELRTRKAFGKAMSPHNFRHAAATTLAINDPDHVRAAAPLLGHRSLETTEQYYIQATGLEAQRSYLEVLKDYKRGGRND